MSICVKIKTEKRFEWDQVFEAISAEGYDVVASKTTPECAFASVFNESLTGVKIAVYNDGYEVSVQELTVFSDYNFFVDVIKVLGKLSGGELLHADGVTKVNCETDFDDTYFARKQMSEFESVLSTVKRTGRIVMLEGALIPVHIGPWLLEKNSLLRVQNYTDDDVEGMLSSLSWDYWELIDMKHASQQILRSNDGESTVCVALIELVDGKVVPFDYVGACDFVAVHDHDTGDYYATPIQWFDLVVCPEQFDRVDDKYYKLTREMTPEDFENVKNAVAYKGVDDFFGTMPYPGRGNSDNRKTYVLMWNPAISSKKLIEHNYEVQKMLLVDFNWSVREYEDLCVGDRFVMVRCGGGNTGAVMSGVFNSYPYSMSDWSGKGRVVYYADMKPNFALNPETAPMLTTEQLQKAIPSFDWTGGASGRLLTDEEAAAFEKLWAEYLASMAEKADGVNVNMIFEDSAI